VSPSLVKYLTVWGSRFVAWSYQVACLCSVVIALDDWNHHYNGLHIYLLHRLIIFFLVTIEIGWYLRNLVYFFVLLTHHLFSSTRSWRLLAWFCGCSLRWRVVYVASTSWQELANSTQEGIGLWKDGDWVEATGVLYVVIRRLERRLFKKRVLGKHSHVLTHTLIRVKVLFGLNAIQLG